MKNYGFFRIMTASPEVSVGDTGFCFDSIKDAIDKAAAEEAMKLSAKLLDTAAGKGIIHHNSADRKKSRMNLKFNKLA